MKYLDDVVMKWDTMESQLENLDLENAFHIMWVYRNIPHILKYSETKLDEIVRDLEKVKVNDFFPASIILQYLNQLMYQIYEIKDQDEELNYLKQACGYRHAEEADDLQVLKKHIFSLCRPIVGLHTKEVVDIMAYAYEMDGNPDFDKLFEVFKDASDILIELHLHKVRIGRKRSRRKNSLKARPMEENKVELDFSNDEMGITKEMEKLNLKESPGDIPGIGDEKPFHCPEACHLKKAKELLLGFENPSLKFYIENLALFLSLQYDEEIFIKFIKYTTAGCKSICANKIFRLTKVPEDKLRCLISSMKGVEKQILMADSLLVNSQTFHMYVNWCISSFKGLSIALVSDFVDISRIFILFARKFPHNSLLKIYKLLWGCNVQKIDEQVKLNLLESFTEIFEIFLKEASINESVGESDNKLKMDQIQDSVDLIDAFVEDPVDVKTTLQNIISEISSIHIYRKAFVRHLAVLKYFDKDFTDKIINELLSNFDYDWRYRVDLLEGCYKEFKTLGLDSKKFLDVFTKDKVFYVRKKALEIKNKLEQ